MRRTFPLISKHSISGFTLIELMVVVAIIAGMVTMAMPYMSSRNQKSKSFLRQFTVLSRDLHTKAKLHGVVYRLVIDMGDPNAREPHQSYWVEKSNRKVFLKENEEGEELKRLTDNKDKDEEKQKDPKGFELDPKFFKEPKELPAGMRFEKIELTRSKEPIVSGKAFIHYMPEGLVDEAALQIKGSEAQQAWTIAIHPLTGRAELISKVTSLKDLKSQ